MLQGGNYATRGKRKLKVYATAHRLTVYATRGKRKLKVYATISIRNGMIDRIERATPYKASGIGVPSYRRVGNRG